ncbi:fungal-specific transcription factor domain-containing protein [Microdochium trichocladiopsis]|uniref:Fungal-specific transcription factor domain-containing protein n=1 Tax=Microdochium trichocladiopsis TaxID=1682393 RepID=A0A9P8Y7W1_9PEZI|nr:fungal-specific transcription factor domain-containing protein [Microdochium trichocladiopsis]KAH7034549.1 fungal-specific transcription factor domain-containing protein [Microdochium trichocladiopsis]
MDFSGSNLSPQPNGGAYDFSTVSSTSTPQDLFDPHPQPPLANPPTSYAPTAGPPRTTMPMTFTPTGPMTLDPSLPPSEALNPRSCVVCRKRKVRCDKHMPCGNCRKANIQCVFPAPGRAPRRPRPKDPNAPPKQASEREVELMKRLRKLEGIVEDLSGQVEIETAKHSGSNDGSPTAATDSAHDDRRLNLDASQRRAPHSDPGDTVKASRRSLDSGVSSPTIGVRRDFGRLVVNDRGKTKYISNAFWAKVNDEINELKAQTQQLSDPDTDLSDNEDSPETHEYAVQGDHHSFVLGYRSSDVDLSSLHPPQTQIPFIWQVYVDNVDPLVKILHVPTMSKTIRALRHNMSDLSPAMEALLFSIYYSAITSMEPAEVVSTLGVEKDGLINQYRFACEQALAKANFLTSTDIVVAQAFALFLVLVRRHDETRFAWTLTAVLTRMGHSMGLHREGTTLKGLKPFDVEMRRRLWWAMCVIDLRGAEDQGTELSIPEGSFDTRLPLNINDVDIDPESTDFPEERVGATDSTFCLVRFEICSFARKVYIAHSGIEGAAQDSLGTVAEREETLEALHKRIDEKYLRESTDKANHPLQWTAATIHRLIMAKIRLMMYQPLFSTCESEEVLSQEMQDRIFLAAVDLVEYTKVLNSEPVCRQWRWLFQTYTQWHAVAFVLIQVIRRPWSASIERGWQALSATFMDPEPADCTMASVHASVWVPMRKLMIKARRHREKELVRLRADPEAARQLDLAESNRLLPASFRHLSASMRNAQAQERWRKLVGREGLDPKTENANAVSGNNSTSAASSQAQVVPRGEPTPQQQEYLNQVMTDPSFTTSNLFDAAFPGESTMDQLRHAAFYGGIFAPGAYDPNGTGSAQQPAQQQQPQQNTMGFIGNAANLTGTFNSPSSKSYSGPITPANGAGATSGVNGSNNNMMNPQAALTPLLSENPPSWLWTEQWGSGPVGGNVEGVDPDVNMDEDFSWQNWQDTLRGFDTEGTLGIGRTGFMGGI